MEVIHDGKIIGDVRVTGVSGQAGVGISQLSFSLAWSIHPTRDHVLAIFGTSLWVSVSAHGQSGSMLGHAVAETAWYDESRDGVPYERHLTYRLTLPTPQLLVLEELRQGGGLSFSLLVSGYSSGAHGLRALNHALHTTVNVSEWVRILKDLRAADILLVGVHLPVDELDAGARTAIGLVRAANEHLIFGQYSVAVAECRRAIESLWKSAHLTQEVRSARKLLSGLNEQMSMTKRARELALGEAVRVFCHTAHHVGEDGESEIFSRSDAALAVAATAAIVSSVVRWPAIASSQAVRSAAVEHLTSETTKALVPKPSSDADLSASVGRAIEHFQRTPANRPRTMKSLRRALASLFANEFDVLQMDGLIERLAETRVIVEIDGKLKYSLPQ